MCIYIYIYIYTYITYKSGGAKSVGRTIRLTRTPEPELGMVIFEWSPEHRNRKSFEWFPEHI